MKRLKLRGRIIERYGTIGAFADAIGISRCTATNVLKGKTTPTQKSIPKWCNALDIDLRDVGIFFTIDPQFSGETE